jgi:hypothetical protein
MTTPRRTLVRRGRRPLVGYLSSRNTLEIEELYDRTIVRLNAGTRAFFLAASAILGPCLAMACMIGYERFLEIPRFIQAVLVLTIAAMTYLFLRTIFIQPSIEILPDGEIRVHHPNLTIPRARIRSITIETDTHHTNNRNYTENAVLVVHTADGDIRLSASPDRPLIERLAHQLRP